MTAAWRAAGRAYYLPLEDLATSADDFEAEPVPAADLAGIIEKDRRIREEFG
jgi:hypothetical protein